MSRALSTTSIEYSEKQIHTSIQLIMEGTSTKHLIAEMRERISNICPAQYQYSDGYLDRWIRYQHTDVDAAISAFKDYLRWRTENNIDSLRDEDYTDLEARFPIFQDLPDKLGRPVIRIFLENWDTTNMPFSEINCQRYRRGGFKLAEQFEDWIKEHLGNSPSVSQCVVVLDCTKLADHMKNVGVKNIYTVARLLKEMISALSVNYPRLFGAIYILNASKWFKFFFSAVKPFMSKDTLSILEMHGTGLNLDWKSFIY